MCFKLKDYQKSESVNYITYKIFRLTELTAKFIAVAFTASLDKKNLKSKSNNNIKIYLEEINKLKLVGESIFKFLKMTHGTL